MKRTIKKASVFLLAALMLATMFVPAMAAYPPVGVTGTTLANVKLKHSLTITDEPYNLDYNIKYSFAVGAAAPMPGSPATGVSGAPSIADISYGPTDDFAGAAGHKIEKEAAITWTGVTFTEPGTYYWQVTTTVDKGSAPENASNNMPTRYLFAHVIDNNGALEVKAVNIADATVDANGFPTLVNKPTPEDQYPATTNDLTVSKTVSGSMGSKEQYFKFDITVNLPAGIPQRAYVVSGTYDTDVPQTAYNPSATNPTGTVTLDANLKTVTVWLKHGQSFTIEDLPTTTTYSIEESYNDGYTVTTATTGSSTTAQEINITPNVDTDTEVTSATGTIGNSAVTVACTNNKDSQTPTGILLQYGAPIAGVLLVAGLMAVLFATKRRKEQEAE